MTLSEPTWDPRCGTEAGARAHNRRRERACRSCCRALRVAKVERQLAHGWVSHPRGWAPVNCPSCGWYMRLEQNMHQCTNSSCRNAGVPMTIRG